MSKVVTNHILGVVSGLLCVLGSIVPAQAGELAVEEKVKTIRNRYDQIERSLGHCKQVKREVLDESTEGGALTGYFSGKSLRKLEAKFYGETGQALEEYYFWNDRLFFVLRVDTRYDKPLSGVVKSKSEERFYFADGVLIRWLHPAKEEISAGPELQQREFNLQTRAKKYSALVRKEDS
jgi:hypothetical protein